MSRSCPGFLDRYGIWNNGFDCSSPRVCCGPEIDRYCCIPSSTSSSSISPSNPFESYEDLDSYTIQTSDNLLAEKWFFIRMCTIGILLAILLIIFIIIYLCIICIRHIQHNKKRSTIQVPLSSPSSSLLLESKRTSLSNRISTITHASNDNKSGYTDASLVLPTSLNLYPTTNSRNSTTSSASSYYMYPNEFEYLCK
ncbi:unnamed protein product [Adineta steineri]|uniref:Shisa N-terminal domain-containing protein n=1 Tax=Adineta steineri TaxID=433720 RepID=A0A813QHC4_9BILA|nr:unnamed protein product [Adineta steineri]